MEIKLLDRDTFFVCGYSVETTLAQNDKDIAALYSSFVQEGKEATLLNLNGSRKGYYGLTWYTQGHERYCYLLGLEVGRRNAIPTNAVLKEVSETTYAMAHFSQGENIIQAWTEFFYTEIPKTGFGVDGERNLYFEYYPGSFDGEYELWVPVVKADV